LYIFLCIMIAFCFTTIPQQLVAILFLVQQDQLTLLHVLFLHHYTFLTFALITIM